MDDVTEEIRPDVETTADGKRLQRESCVSQPKSKKVNRRVKKSTKE